MSHKNRTEDQKSFQPEGHHGIKKGQVSKNANSTFKNKTPIEEPKEKNSVDEYEMDSESTKDFEGADEPNTPYHDLEMNGSISQNRSEERKH